MLLNDANGQAEFTALLFCNICNIQVKTNKLVLVNNILFHLNESKKGNKSYFK